jgi:poly(3-hydroxybutyrate) depolymerase
VLGPLLYNMYQAQRAYTSPVYASAALTAKAFQAMPDPIQERMTAKRVIALDRVLSSAKVTHRRPPFTFGTLETDGKPVTITEEVIDRTPFAQLLHFAKEGAPEQPKVLLVAPMSGHFSTMLSPTLRALMRDNDVYITDWRSAREIPRSQGPFGLDDYTEHLMRFVRHIGPGVHIVAVCQPCVSALVATTMLAAEDDPCQPASLTLMSGPIDTRVNATKVDETAIKRPLAWFRSRCITVVPPGYKGAGRRVYPGFLQLSGFLALNPRRHLKSHVQMYRDFLAGDIAAGTVRQDFYTEYFAVCDMPEEFYLDTVEKVFQLHLLPRGELDFRGRRVDPAVIHKTALLTVEAELDDMCAPGQTDAAHELCRSLTDSQRGRYLQQGVGHYGVFAGHRWDQEIYPVVRDFIAAHDRQTISS